MMVNVHENELGYALNEMLELLGINQDDYFDYFSRSVHNTTVRPKKIIKMPSITRK